MKKIRLGTFLVVGSLIYVIYDLLKKLQELKSVIPKVKEVYIYTSAYLKKFEIERRDGIVCENGKLKYYLGKYNNIAISEISLDEEKEMLYIINLLKKVYNIQKVYIILGSEKTALSLKKNENFRGVSFQIKYEIEEEDIIFSESDEYTFLT